MTQRAPAPSGRYSPVSPKPGPRTVATASTRVEDAQDRQALEQAAADLASGRLETVTLAKAKAELGD